jgi:hypothetical protein
MTEKDPVTVVGEFEFVSKSYGDGWAWGTLITMQGGKKVPVKITGVLDGFRRGSCVIATGTWAEHPKYGRQLKADSVIHETPSTEDGVVSWLTEHLPQIGPVRARALVDKFGMDLWDTIENDPDKLTVISGMTKERVDELVIEYHRYKHTREQQAALYTQGYTQKEAHKIVKGFDTQAAATGAQPHVLYLLQIISFARAEFISARIGVSPDDRKRVQAAVLEYVTQQSASSGHTLFDEDEIIDGTSDMIGLPDRIALREGIYVLVEERNLKALGGRVFMPTSAYHSEMTVASQVESLLVAQRLRDQEKERQDELDRAHAGAGTGGANASDEEGQRGDRRSRHRKDHDPQDGAREDGERGARGTDREGGSANGGCHREVDLDHPSNPRPADR